MANFACHHTRVEKHTHTRTRARAHTQRSHMRTVVLLIIGIGAALGDGGSVICGSCGDCDCAPLAKQAGFLNTIPGIKIPESIIAQFADHPEPLKIGVDYAAKQIEEFRSISHGVHIMTVGREDLVPVILDKAGL